MVEAVAAWPEATPLPPTRSTGEMRAVTARAGRRVRSSRLISDPLVGWMSRREHQPAAAEQHDYQQQKEEEQPQDAGSGVDAGRHRQVQGRREQDAAVGGDGVATEAAVG